MTEMMNVAIIGAGIMGHGIAEVAAISGQNVNLVDVSEEILTHAKERIEASVSKLYKKGVIKDEPSKVIKRIRFTSDLEEAVRGVDLVIEAVPEDIEVKRKIFTEIDRYAPIQTIFATNTSGLSVNALSQATSRPERFVGMHWMNPPVLMPLIEIVRGDLTNEAVIHKVIDLCKHYGKETVIAKKDVWYFLSARSQVGWHLEAAIMVHQGRASVQEVDAMARYKLGLPMGPFEMADLTGACEIRTTGLESAKKILKERPEFEPWPALLAAFEYAVDKLWRPMSQKGLTGVKAGKGFYAYPTPGEYRKVDISREIADKVNPIELLAPAANTSAWCVTNGVGTREEVDLCFRRAYGWPKGIFQLVQEFGAQAITKELEKKQKSAPEALQAFYEPDQLLKQWA